MDTEIIINICVYVGQYIHIFPALCVGKPSRRDTPKATDTTAVRASWRNDWLLAWDRESTRWYWASYSARNQGNAQKNWIDESMPKGPRCQPESAPNGQS